MSRLGERGEVVNTSGCEPDIREFDSHRSPQNRIHTLIKSRIYKRSENAQKWAFFLIYRVLELIKEVFQSKNSRSVKLNFQADLFT